MIQTSWIARPSSAQPKCASPLRPLTLTSVAQYTRISSSQLPTSQPYASADSGISGERPGDANRMARASTLCSWSTINWCGAIDTSGKHECKRTLNHTRNGWDWESDQSGGCLGDIHVPRAQGLTSLIPHPSAQCELCEIARFCSPHLQESAENR